jgi:hypothetical protein
MEVLGIDIGRVIISGDGPGDTSFFTGDHLGTPEVTGASAAIRRLVDERFGSRVHLISKAYRRVEQRTREWLISRSFAEATGLAEDRWHFVRERPEKGPLCARLGITHFIDDRAENLVHARNHGVANLLLFGGESGDGFTATRDWTAVIDALL